MVAAQLAASAPAVAASGLPDDVVRLLAADPFPAYSLAPGGRYLLLLHKRGLLPIKRLAEPTLTVGGVRINPDTHARHAAVPYTDLTLVDVETGTSRPLEMPANTRIGYPQWSPDGSRFFFTVTTAGGVELWTAAPGRVHPARLLGGVLNATRAAPCRWMPGGHRLLCRLVVPEPGGEESSASLESGENLLAVGLPPSSGRRESLAERFLRSQLAGVDAASGEVRPIGVPAVFESVEPSPDGDYLLVSRQSSSGTGASVIAEVWDASGRVVHELQARDAAPRAVHWQPSMPATLVWVERSAGREHIMSQPVPARRPARVLHESSHRFAGLQWLEESNRALFSEYDRDRGATRVWLIGPGVEHARLVGSRDVGGRRPGLGRPLTTENEAGQTVVRVHDGAIFLRGQGIGDRSARAYLARMDLETLASELMWTGDDAGAEKVEAMIDPDGRRLLTRHEGPREPPDYRIRDPRAGTVQPVTDHRHPVPELLDHERRVLHYRRDDGFELSATLHLPPDAAAKDPLPLILWAYPRRYNAELAPPALTATDDFVDVERSMRMFFLLLGYAVMDDVAMPVVGDSRSANDTFVEQVVANARAAIGAAAATGLVDPARVGVAGHSYGAFMVANLLAHSDLFRAGVGLSGAYNRTLTPFGFQTERRTLWEARETYLKMSPFLYSDQIEAPLLLVHGMLDDNAGTAPVQSQYFHEAIRRNGGDAELLLLPFEGHHYRGRESVMEVASAMARWFDTHLRPAAASDIAGPGAAADDTATAAVDQ